MNINIEDYDFEGPYESVQSIHARSGVYVVYDYNKSEGYCRLDVRESENVYEQLLDHERIHCWEQHSRGTLVFAVYYTNEATRGRVAKKIREHSNLPCGPETTKKDSRASHDQRN